VTLALAFLTSPSTRTFLACFGHPSTSIRLFFLPFSPLGLLLLPPFALISARILALPLFLFVPLVILLLFYLTSHLLPLSSTLLPLQFPLMLLALQFSLFQSTGHEILFSSPLSPRAVATF